ncbi:MAG: exo-beta-N-acetylmuramidase NamZ family protein [Thermomicrobiales bacterium]
MTFSIRTGLEVFVDGGGRELDGMNVGLVTNPNGVDRTFRSGIELLHESARVQLKALFGPEHGVRGDAQAGAHIPAATDPGTGLPVYSLYGETRRPTPEMLEGLDAAIIDMQDLGVRYATYLSTMIEVQAAANDAGIEVVIFDRPNPLADIAREGNLLEPAFTSFVGSHPIPIRHGMTLGELGSLIAHERGWKAPIVVPVDGLVRETWYDETGIPWILPSPNMPTLDALTLYGGTCLIEGTSLSEGRGTTRPFEFVGAPGVDANALAADLTSRELPGLSYRPVHFSPSFSKHKDEICAGVQVYCTDRTIMCSAPLGIHLLHALKTHTPDFSWVTPWDDGRPYFIDLLLGSDKPRLALDGGATPDEIMTNWVIETADFDVRRRPFLLYPEGGR